MIYQVFEIVLCFLIGVGITFVFYLWLVAYQEFKEIKACNQLEEYQLDEMVNIALSRPDLVQHWILETPEAWPFIWGGRAIIKSIEK
jgi:hypothetical protein